LLTITALVTVRYNQMVIRTVMKLSFQNIEKDFSGLHVIENFSRDIDDGELVALVGPSGCGKSTLLHIAAGLEKPSAGSILADGRPIEGPHPERTLMFQENALYPWLTLAQNVALALEFQKTDKQEALRQARDWLAKVNLKGFEDYFPHQVSGGMRQRAALARAFISQPKALLLDEPFGALDALTRMTLQDALRTLIREAGPTVLLVTHDVDEALFLADRILVFSPRPATVLKEFNLSRHEKTHDLSEFAAMRREILGLLGIHAEHEEAAATPILEEVEA
jgi:NitT/TauT family transport system ATP-binding protein